MEAGAVSTMISLSDANLIMLLKRFNSPLHVLLAVALVVASLMIMVEFSAQVLAAVRAGELAQGFLNSLEILFIVWTLSSLISAKIEYIQTIHFHLRVFIGVAMIVLLINLIIEPIQVASGTKNDFDLMHYAALLVAILIVGIVHRLVGDRN